MSERKEKRTLLLLYALGVYIALQLVWWGYLQVSLNREMLAHIAEETGTDQSSNFQKKVWMILGEGSVFLILLAIGFFRIRKNISGELRLARMEKTFLLSVTHELKTPIAAIKLMLETMKRGKTDPAANEKLIQDALRETQRLQTLSENILLVTRFDQPGGGFVFEQVNLSDIVKQCANRTRQSLGEKAILECSIVEDVQVQGDEQLLSALCMNLLENAFKYGGLAGKVLLQLSVKNNQAILIVSDFGPGIPESEQHLVFEKFYRIGNEETRKHKGTGLGLYLARNIARFHNARISVRNQEPQGAIFEILIPLQQQIHT
jgi:signal transduction histidine kinase